ncbi:hypothetical protein ACFQJD_00295 [Haloplanus sp. GCM10025708]|uniref:hypothetical protein n=1 Tax=Haloplanus sp. GCM10025708 TaxID=3252679 RepID=UPI003624134F
MDVSVVADSGASEAAHAPRERPGGKADANPSAEDAESEAGVHDEARRVVEAVAADEGWTDDGRREARVEAAVAALEAAHSRGSLGKSEALDELGLPEEYPVRGQDGETWWRKNVRPVLQAVGDYDSGVHGYRVDLDAGDGSDVYDPTAEF